MPPKAIFFIIGLFSLLWVDGTNLYAQACCSGGTPLSSNLGVQKLAEGYLQIELSYDYNTQRALVNGSKRLDDRFRRRNTHAILLRGKYAFSDRISVIGLFSWVRQEEDNRPLAGTARFASAEGMGDLIGLIQYQLWSKGAAGIMVAAGVKAPVGKTDVVDPATDLLLNADLQPGTGSWDWLGVLHFRREQLWREGMSFSLSLTYRLTSDYQRFDGQQTYRFGNELQAFFGLTDQFTMGSGLFYPQLMFRFRRTDADLTNGINTPNTGGNWIFAVPGILYQPTPDLGFNLSAEIPLYRNLTGIQLTTSLRLNLGVTYSFDSNQN